MTSMWTTKQSSNNDGSENSSDSDLWIDSHWWSCLYER